jgi:hypothetical protein
MDYEMAWSHCCSIGMKPIEFADGNYAEIVEKLAKGLPRTDFVYDLHFKAKFLGNGAIYAYSGREMYMGETEAYNATHERWCQSKEIISAKLLINSKFKLNNKN